MSEWKAFEEWFGSQYNDMLHLGGLEGGIAYKKLLSRLSQIPAKFTGLMRMQAFVRLRYGYPMSKGGYTCVVLSMRTKRAEVIFALCYLSGDRIEYICISPTFESMDGEYRHRFIQFEAFEKGYAMKEKDLSLFESKILELIGNGTLAVESSIYPSEKAEAAMAAIEGARLSIRALAVSLILDSWRSLQVHTIPSYTIGIKDIQGAWPKMEDEAKRIALTRGTGFFQRGAPAEFRVECGQKISPLMLREVMAPYNINFGPWRELYARQAASNLVINGVSPSLHLDNQWVYIEGMDAGLFENKSMESKLRRGKTADMSVGSLRVARTTIAPEVSESYAASSFDAHIFEAIEIAQSFLMTSDVALCSTMEHAGNTLASTPGIFARIQDLTPQLRLLMADVDHMAKFAFDVLFGAHCLHTKSHIVQGDLHANNFTLHQFTTVFSPQIGEKGEITFKQIVDNPIVAYVAGPRGEADTYVFPYTGLIGCIIDFSRAIFGPGMQKELNKEFGEDFTRNFYRDQVTRAMRGLHRYAPAFVEKNQEAIKAAFLADFDTAFRVLSYIDFVAVGASIARILTDYVPLDTDKREFSPAKECIDFAKHIEKRSRERLVIALHDMIEKKRTGKIPFAGEVLLADLFSKYKYSPMRADIKKATLCDVYNYNAPLKYDGRDYETFPPWARLDKIEEKLGGIKIAEVLGRGMQPFLDALLPSAHVDVVAETVRAEQEALDHPAAATSSWIE